MTFEFASSDLTTKPANIVTDENRSNDAEEFKARYMEEFAEQ